MFVGGDDAPLVADEPGFVSDAFVGRELSDATLDASSDAGTTPPPFVTETMAELYLQQGFNDEALAVYRQLAALNPEDAGLADRVRHLEHGSRSSMAIDRVSQEIEAAAEAEEKRHSAELAAVPEEIAPEEPEAAEVQPSSETTGSSETGAAVPVVAAPAPDNAPEQAVAYEPIPEPEPAPGAGARADAGARAEPRAGADAGADAGAGARARAVGGSSVRCGSGRHCRTWWTRRSGGSRGLRRRPGVRGPRSRCGLRCGGDAPVPAGPTAREVFAR